MLLDADASPGFVTGFRALGVKTCSLYMALADSDADLRDTLADMLGVVKSKRVAHRLESARLLQVWQQSKTRSVKQIKLHATARALGLPCELPHGAWGNFGTCTMTPFRRMNYLLSPTQRRCCKTGLYGPSRWLRWCPWKPKRLTYGTTERVLPTMRPRRGRQARCQPISRNSRTSTNSS